MTDDNASIENRDRFGNMGIDARYVRDVRLSMFLIVSAMLVLLTGQAVTSEPDIIFGVLTSVLHSLQY